MSKQKAFLEKLHIKNFLSLRNITLPLKSLTVLVGPNASGKSNVLSALYSLRSMMTDEKLPPVELVQSYLWAGKASHITFQLQTEVKETSAIYELEFKADVHNPFVAEELLVAGIKIISVENGKGEVQDENGKNKTTYTSNKVFFLPDLQEWSSAVPPQTSSQIQPEQMNPYSEDELIEQPTINLLTEMGWETRNCHNEFNRGDSPLGRHTKSEVVLIPRLQAAFARLNPNATPEAIAKAIEELTHSRSLMSIVEANREIYTLLKDGVRVTVSDPSGDSEATEVLQVIDWNTPENNDFFAASQFWITGEMYTKRPDLICFVNGIPLILMEFKRIDVNLYAAYNDNLRDYKDTIPHLFWYNAFIFLSNGTDSKVGSLTASWEHFAEWKRIHSENEPPKISLETILRALCEPQRLLDVVENFILFMEAQGGLIKILAKNHQYLGVNNTIASLNQIQDNQGKLGVFWHTQGSGKSISMLLFAQKVLRKVPGNWTFVVVTDRKELDDQIYKTFASTSGVLTQQEVHAERVVHLRQLLSEDHRYIFTLIQKFQTQGGERHPILSERSDIVVITDEAHRSQYDTLALNMRTALPNAAFIAFTGTPLMAGEEKTKSVFGDYVSVYDFNQSILDRATVPLYYENRVPTLPEKSTG
ncbi:HsdR family type I site-specific deoxyribonuclease [Candidatus Poribacteria bacterium]|nr:HsdR family type I site-specific deoxyribonuclease [Candidatus Poribacteria bacterium]